MEGTDRSGFTLPWSPGGRPGTAAGRLRWLEVPLSDAVSYPIWVNALIFAAAAGVIWIFGSRLTRHLDGIAVKQKLDHAFVGMLLLGGITSLPELANTVTASAIGDPALGINNLLGSAAINVFLLAIADAVVGRKAVTSIVAQPSTMMMASLCMIVLIVIAFAITIGDIALAGLGVGIASLAIGGLAVFCFWLASGHDERSRWTVEEEGCDTGAVAKPRLQLSLPALWLRVAIDGACIFAAGYALSQTGDAIAQQAGLTSAVVGFGLIGTATSLPELVTVIAALRLCRPEMAFGQILGTNFVNLSLIPLGDAVFDGEPVLNTLGKFEVLSALLGTALIGVFMVGLLEHRNRTIFRMGIDSAVVMAVFACGCGLLALV